MVHSIGIGSIGEPLVKQSLDQVASTPSKANPSDTLHFEEAMQTKQEAGVPLHPTVTPTLSVSQAADRASGIKPVGESILENLDRMHTRFKDINTQMQAVVSQPTLSPEELLKLQLQIHEVTADIQLVGQSIGKFEQNIDTLLKSS